ncbi:MAG: hypothetical protein AAB392_01340 [Patescibacteria group bacterium]
MLFNLLKKKKNKSPILVFRLFFVIAIFFLPTQADAQFATIAASLVAGLSDYIAGGFLAFVGWIPMVITSFILIISGTIYDFILHFTVVNMAKNIGTGTPIGNSITEAWVAIRDVANMAFIFVLLYAAFRTMFLSEYGNIGKTILNIILIALLINFSLFFTKVVIDASNIAADGFYRAISSGNEVTLSNNGSSAANKFLIGTERYSGIAGGYMRMLGMSTIFGTGPLSSWAGSNQLVYGFLTGTFMLMAALMFIITGIMFIARFIILIYLMILSPFAFIAFVIPGQSGKFGEWWYSLINQAFFAPLYFALTWVTFKVGSAIITLQTFNNSNRDWSSLVIDPSKAFGVLISYILVMGLSIAALVISKNLASKGATAAAFKGITGAVGTGAIGGVALAGRQTFGRVASRLEKSQDFQRWAGSSRIGNVLYTGTQKAARGSYDIRSSETIRKAPGLGKELDILGTPTEKGRGGFEKYREEKTKRVLDKGKQFTDRQARVNYARRIASKLHVVGGSTPGNVNSLFGMMGRSNRVGAATLIDERIRELRTEMNTARGELNTLNNQMGFTPNTGAYVGIFVAPATMVATLTPAEQARYTILMSGAVVNGSIANMSAEMQTLNDPATGLRHTLGLDNTLKQQF